MARVLGHEGRLQFRLFRALFERHPLVRSDIERAIARPKCW